MKLIKNIFSDTIHLFYPHLCPGCGSDAMQKESLICLSCIVNLPETNFALLKNNPVEKIFWGRLPLTTAHSQFYFTKEEVVQQLIHELKYKGNTAIGFYLGEMMGNTLLSSGRFTDIDVLVPLPLYPDKERKRGYNQATVICNGIAAAMNIPVMKDNIVRKKATGTQTRKRRTERWQNVEDSFAVNNPAQLAGKHILLVDDVITTGATLEACGNIIMKTPGVKLSIASLALAGN